MRGFLFDMDGTILDSLGDIGGCANAVLEELGLPTHPIETYRQRVGEGARSLLEQALPPDRGALVDHALARYRALYATRMLETSRPYPGIEPLLVALRARGDRVAVVTNKPQTAATKIAEAVFPGTFEIVIGEREGVPKKPDPAPALLAASALGIEPGRCVFVGDSAVDVRTARAAGMKSVGVLWGFRDRDELAGAGAEHLVDEAGQILGL
ncbi:MAG: HAD family hydrolase [Sandaracinus sp.]